MSEVRWEIPETWKWAAAGDIAKIAGGGTPSSKIEDNFLKLAFPGSPQQTSPDIGELIFQGAVAIYPRRGS